MIIINWINRMPLYPTYTRKLNVQQHFVITWFPPLFGLMNTSTGVTFAVGIGLMTNVLASFSFDFFLPAGFFFGDFRSDDLKLPLRGSFTIHDGGTIILEWGPAGVLKWANQIVCVKK